MRKLLTSLAICGSVSFVHANPSGPTVIEGDNFNFSTNGNTLDVSTTSSRSIVDWDTFSVGIYDTLNFNLPNSSSAILNRVTTEQTSEILGQMNSNGQVYLVNPYGILIGSDATINVHTFLASTLNADNEEFLAGNDMTFVGDANSDVSLINYGTITADGGDVILLSYQASQQGDIYAADGTVAIGGGIEIVLQVYDPSARIAIVPHSAMSTVTLGADMGGYIQAIKTELKADGNAYTTAINHTGWIDAQGPITQDSAVIFSAPDGLAVVDGLITSYDASGNKGGYVAISGYEVDVTASTTIAAAGPEAGGTVYIGGGFNGEDPDVLNSSNTNMSGLIQVDAQYAGGGGIAVVWASDGPTTFNGTITAQGGTTFGDGGIVEVAAGGTGASLSFQGTVDVTHRDEFGNDGYLVKFPCPCP